MYEVTIKQAIKSWNDKNPTLRKKTLSSLAAELGTTTQYLSQLGKRHTKQINKHFEVILSDDKEQTKKLWKLYFSENKSFSRLHLISQILECEIYDLVKKIKKS